MMNQQKRGCDLLSKCIFIFLLLFSSLFSQSKGFFQPSAYFTYGKYSDKTNFTQFSFFASSGWNNYDFIVLGYDRIELINNSKNKKLNYQQNNFAGGIHYLLRDNNIKLKFDYQWIDGSYKSNTVNKPVISSGYLVSPELIAGVYPFHYGTGYAYFNEKGGTNLVSNQIYFRTDFYPHYKFLINTILSAHLISDNRKQTSLQITAYYFPFYELALRGSFTVGSRSIFYNPDLMVLNNQHETQISNYSVQLSYNFYKNFTGILQYQNSKFSSYQVDYFVFGIKSHFTF